jgi:hypothetical protein
MMETSVWNDARRCRDRNFDSGFGSTMAARLTFALLEGEKVTRDIVPCNDDPVEDLFPDPGPVRRP